MISDNPAAPDTSGSGGSQRVFRTDVLICLTLLAVTFGLYSQVRNADFIFYDDPGSVTENTHLPHGLSAAGIKWALTSGDFSNWFPLTRLVFIVEYQLFGLRSGGYHVVNVLFHALASVLLYLFLVRASRARWPSAFVAFLFALHPLHVESVAWVTELKDVLSAFFWFFTLWAWVGYTEYPTRRRYLLTLLLFVLGLISKPMMVTLPLVLFLLDIWPLSRIGGWKPIVEKIPFLALSAGSATVTYRTQRVTGAVKPFDMFPLGGRIANALITEVVYIVKMFWPTDLAIFYPYPDQPDVPRAIAAALLLFSISAVVLFCLRSRSYLAVGWFWYLITLVPVIGLVQVGVQARADRYMYLPMVGLAIMLAFGGDDLVRHWPRAKLAVAGLAAGGLIALVPVTWVQLGYWKDNETVFRHAIDVTPANSISYYELAQGLSLLPGRQSDAITAFELGLSVLGDNDRLHAALGATLLETHLPENVPLAEQHLRAALRIRPSYADAHANLAAVLIKTGRFAEAVDHARWALQSKPENPATHNDLSVALDETGHPQEAIDEAKKALALKPDFLEAHQNLGATLFRLGRLDEATLQFSEVVRLYPHNAEGHYNLGLALEKTGKKPEALHEFEEAVRLAPDYRPAQLRLGLFLSRMPDRIPEAVSHIQAALNLRPDPNLRKLLEKLQSAPPSGVTVARSGTRPAAQ